MFRRVTEYIRAALVRAAAVVLFSMMLGASEPPVVVVWTSGIEPFEQARKGLRSGLDPAAVAEIDLKEAKAEVQLEQAARRPPRLVIAVGTNALAAVKKYRIDTAVLATMVLQADAQPIVSTAAWSKAGEIYLDVPVAEVAARLTALFPGKGRMGVIRNPLRDAAIDSGAGRRHGFAIDARDCSSPEELMKSLLSLRRKADFVLIYPDASLYNEATARPFLMASIDNQLPIIGFSASLVRAGAALGIYPDFEDIGQQTGEAARRYLASGGAPPNEAPRKLTVSANQSVLRLLGLKYVRTPDYPVTEIK